MMPPPGYRIDLDTLARRVVQNLDRRGQTTPRQFSTRINTQQNGVLASNAHRVLNIRSSGVTTVTDDANRRSNLVIPAGYLMLLVDGAGSPIIPSSSKAALSIHIHDNLNILSWAVIGDVAGSCTIDLKAAAWASYPSTASIITGTHPNLTGQRNNKSPDYIDPATGVLNTGWVNLGWSTLAMGSVLDLFVTAASTVTRLTITLQCQAY